MLMSTAPAVAAEHAELAATMLVDAVKNGWFMNDVARTRNAARVLRTVRLPADSALTPLVRTALGLGDLVGDPLHHLPTQEHNQFATPKQSTSDTAAASPLARILVATAATAVGNDPVAIQAATTAVRLCRSTGQVGWLPLALQLLASTEMLSGRHEFAAASASEGLDLADALGQDNRVCHFRALLAWLHAVRGDEESCRDLAMLSLRHAEAHRITPTVAIGQWALGLLELGRGHTEQALTHLLPRSELTGAHPVVVPRQTPDLVEAAVRAGRGDLVRPHVDRFAAWTASSDQTWAVAALARCHALLAGQDEDAERHFTAALHAYERAEADGHPRPFDRARTQLLYGEWLRRMSRRSDARTPLRAAAQEFHRLDAAPWARRASAELRATGQQQAGPVAVPAGARLTPQELQVVRLAAMGASNKEIAAQLFLSPRTVGYHLYKAFPKLGVGSRSELAHLLLTWESAGRDGDPLSSRRPE
jgi:DNA-binding CsgD family transcriptional regulator